MLSIKPIGSSSAQVQYYAELTVDYYAGESQTPGRWWGRGGVALGLNGAVDCKTLGNLLRGYSNDGTKLVQNAGSKKRRSAFDLTFSVPKSVSALFSQCDPDGREWIESACESALARTLTAFDELCSVTRRGKLGHRSEKAGLVAAIFRHEASRGMPGEIPDPNIHFHVVVANVAVRADGTTGALDAGPLFRRHMKMTLGAMFRTELSKELSILGLRTHRPTRSDGKPVSWFEVSGVPTRLIEEFSKRRVEIEKWLRKKGLSGAKAAEKAALKTRRAKGKFSRQELFSSWTATGAKHDFTQNHAMSLFGQTINQPEATNANAAVNEAIRRINEDNAYFSELELLRYSAEASQCQGVGSQAIRAAVSKILRQSPELVRLSDIGGERTYTTTEMLKMEAHMLAGAERLAKQHTHRLHPERLTNVLMAHESLRGEQAEAIRHLTTTTGGIACVNGLAGTGKTHMLSVACKVWESEGFEVVGTALASTAAKGLQEGSGISSTHIHQLLWEIGNNRRKLHSQTILVVDEAGMVGTRQIERLVSLVGESGSKLVLVGNYSQLQPIEAGGPFRAIAERVGVANLREIIRQRKRWARKAVAELEQGKAETALQRFAKRGLLKIAEDREEAIEQLAHDWHRMASIHSLDQMLIFAGTNVEVANVNRCCQERRLLAGELGIDSIVVGRDRYYTGDRILFTRNDASLLIRNGTTGTVDAIDIDASVLHIRTDDGHIVAIDTNVYDQLQLGYGLTTHRGQGKTVEQAFMLTGGPMTDREMSYVQGSRARGETCIYSDVVTGGPDIAAIAKQMNKSRAKDLAHDHILE